MKVCGFPIVLCSKKVRIYMNLVYLIHITDLLHRYLLGNGLKLAEVLRPFLQNMIG